MRPVLVQFVLALLLGLAARSAPAKLPAHPWHPVRGAADSAAPPLDTARALTAFFAHRRKKSRAVVPPAATVVLVFNCSLAYSKSETTWQQVSRGFNVAVIGYFGYHLGKALIELRRYRPARERALLAALARGEPLPAPVRTRLLAYLKPAPPRP